MANALYISMFFSHIFVNFRFFSKNRSLHTKEYQWLGPLRGPSQKQLWRNNTYWLENLFPLPKSGLAEARHSNGSSNAKDFAHRNKSTPERFILHAPLQNGSLADLPLHRWPVLTKLKLTQTFFKFWNFILV